MVTIGVLALQGDFSKHLESLSKLCCRTKEVRSAEELFACDGLIIPGGESTVMSCHLERQNLRELLIVFARTKPVFGTCAGLILLSKDGILNLLSVRVNRNAYGRQVDSFSTKLGVTLNGLVQPTEALFIRAPKITEVLSKNVEVLATFENDPVLVKQGHLLGATFHPELTNDVSIHQYFLEETIQCKKRKKMSHPRP